MMKQFIYWIFDSQNRYANGFTLLSVVLSGIVSWAISALYFSKGNKENLRSSMLYPMKRLLEEQYSWKNYNSLTELYNGYSAKFLKESERKIIDELLSTYKVICTYHYDRVCAESLFLYFCHKLEKNGIDTKSRPLYIQDEIVDMDFPIDLLYMRDDLAKAINQYPPEYDTANCKKAVILLFKIYAKTCYETDAEQYFDDFSIKDILKNAHNRSKWDDKFSEFKEAKKAFLGMKVIK